MFFEISLIWISNFSLINPLSLFELSIFQKAAKNTKQPEMPASKAGKKKSIKNVAKYLSLSTWFFFPDFPIVFFLSLLSLSLVLLHFFLFLKFFVFPKNIFFQTSDFSNFFFNLKIVNFYDFHIFPLFPHFLFTFHAYHRLSPLITLAFSVLITPNQKAKKTTCCQVSHNVFGVFLWQLESNQLISAENLWYLISLISLFWRVFRSKKLKIWWKNFFLKFKI